MAMDRSMRLFAGVIASLAAGLLLGLIPRSTHQGIPSIEALGIGWSLAIENGLAVLLCSVAGAFVARTRFHIPALTIVIITWVALVLIIHQIAAPLGRVDLWNVVVSNLPSLVVAAAAALIGAQLGLRLSRAFWPGSQTKGTRSAG